MKITDTITITRECCDATYDLVGSKKLGFAFAECKHCGAVFKQKRFTDAAGDTDWEWTKVDYEKAVAK